MQMELGSQVIVLQFRGVMSHNAPSWNKGFLDSIQLSSDKKQVATSSCVHLEVERRSCISTYRSKSLTSSEKRKWNSESYYKI